MPSIAVDRRVDIDAAPGEEHIALDRLVDAHRAACRVMIIAEIALHDSLRIAILGRDAQREQRRQRGADDLFHHRDLH